MRPLTIRPPAAPPNSRAAAPPRSRAASRLLGVLGVLMAAALALTGPALAGAASAAPVLAASEQPEPSTESPGDADPGGTGSTGSTDSTELAANAYPGVQLITTTYRATVSVPMPVLDQAAVQALAGRVATQALSGVIGTDQQALTAAIVDAIADSPDTYFDPGPGVHSRRQSLTGTGTGWVITPDGYLITAAHVVSTPEAQLREEFAQTSLSRMGRQFVRGLQGSGLQLTPDQLDRLTRAVLGWFAARMSVDDLQVSVAANLALGFDGLGKDQRPVEAEVVDVGKPYPGNDVALLKIDGQQHLPTIDLGSDDDVSPGKTVHVVGFPAASTFSAGMSADAQVQPTVTQGPVTAVKSTASGMPVFQTQAPASPGNSGGPVLLDDGRSVGVLVAGAIDSDGSAAQGQMFVVPASEVSDMLEQNGVTAERSDTSQAYAAAVDAFYADRFKQALPLFEKVQTLYPAHPFAASFVADAKTAIDEGRDRTPAPEEAGSSTAIWLGLGVGAAVLVGGAAALVLVRRARGARRSPGAGPAGPYPAWPGADGRPAWGPDGAPAWPAQAQPPGYEAWARAWAAQQGQQDQQDQQGGWGPGGWPPATPPMSQMGPGTPPAADAGSPWAPGPHGPEGPRPPAPRGSEDDDAAAAAGRPADPDAHAWRPPGRPAS